MNCNGLIEYQRRYYEAKRAVEGTTVETQLRGYPYPGTKPASIPNQGNKENWPGTKANESTQKRKACSLCNETGHEVQQCSQLENLINSYKKSKPSGEASANVAEGSGSSNSGSSDDDTGVAPR